MNFLNLALIPLTHCDVILPFYLSLSQAEAPAKEAVDATTQPVVKTSTDVAPSKDTDAEAESTKEEAQTEEETAVESKKRSADNAAIADEEKVSTVR